MRRFIRSIESDTQLSKDRKRKRKKKESEVSPAFQLGTRDFLFNR